MSVAKVSFNAFDNAFKQTHPSCTAPQSTLNKIWDELKHKYKCDQQKYRHHGGAKAFPDEFHTEASEIMNQWKINHKQKNAVQQSIFYGLFSRNKNKHKIKINRQRDMRKTVHSIQRNSTKREELDSMAPKSYTFTNFMESLNFDTEPSSPDLYNPIYIARHTQTTHLSQVRVLLRVKEGIKNTHFPQIMRE